MRILIIAVASLVLSACSTLRSDLGLQNNGAVQTPIYSANRVLFASRLPDVQGRFSQLDLGYERATDWTATAQPQGLQRAVRNRQPLSIVVSRAYLPANIGTCAPRGSDAFFSGSRRTVRDIAVLLDVSTAQDRSEFIAVWYQRDVPADEMLTFQDLLVYSTDAWDSKYPPYFRLRLVDVSSERNTAIGQMLDQVRSASGTITSLLGTPAAAPVINIATLAARQVLAHERNKPLVDFTFQLYGEHLLAEAGGVPLGVLQTGGMVVTAAPCESGAAFWEGNFNFDHRLNRIVTRDEHQVQAMPYIFATILTADLAVPQIVRTRSAAIMERLTNPQIVQTELQLAQQDVERLTVALSALNVRETFRRRPSADAFATMVSSVSNGWNGFDSVEKGFFLDSFYQTTGRSLPDGPAYVAWIANCRSNAQFDEQSGRFRVDRQVSGADGSPCWP